MLTPADLHAPYTTFWKLHIGQKIWTISNIGAAVMQIRGFRLARLNRHVSSDQGLQNMLTMEWLIDTPKALKPRLAKSTILSLTAFSILDLFAAFLKTTCNEKAMLEPHEILFCLQIMLSSFEVTETLILWQPFKDNTDICRTFERSG